MIDAMRWATTERLIELNDEAVLHDFNEWLTADFFNDVDPDGRHVLALAIPHGVRPDGRNDDWPPHWRTMWYAEMSDRSYPIKLDVTDASLQQLQEIPGTPTVGVIEGFTTSTPVATVEVEGERWLLDGKHVLEAASLNGVTDLPETTYPGISIEYLNEIRSRVPLS
jgi:hypothetical protein